MKRNVFIPGLSEHQRGELETTRQAENVHFHGLLDVDTVVNPDNFSFNKLLDQMRQALQRFPGSVDGIIAHWDFPTSVIVPNLCKEYGLPTPSLESVLKCEHKYWSRLEQEKAIPDYIPRFNGFDPFDDRALDRITLDYPFWIKPVKSFSSQLGFKIRNADEFREAIIETREGIARIGDAFDEALALVELPEEIRQATGNTCIAEEIISGVQVAPEGSMFQGEFSVHGVLDMHKDETGRSFSRFEYPTALPRSVRARIIDACERFLRHIEFDNGCFNAEFMWDSEHDKLWLIEVNTRISQSHSEFFHKVDGMSNHEVAIDVALGVRPRMPYREGKHAVAAKCMILHHEDATVARVPDRAELERLDERFPGTHVELDVEPGMRLSELPNQDSYSYILGTLFLGADSHEQLRERYRACLDALHFEFEPVQQPAKDAS